MSKGLTATAILVSVVFSSNQLAFCQVDSFMINVHRNIENSEREKAFRTDDENKLDGALLHILQLAEQQDTSGAKRAELSRLMKSMSSVKFLRIDSGGRIRVVIDLRSLADTNSVKELIRRAGGEIKHVGLLPYVSCDIEPKKLRDLIFSPAVLLISQPMPNETHDIVSAGDVQLKANLVRSQYGAYGDGVTIGVISDGVDHLPNVPTPSELPSNVTVIPGHAGSGDEGTAMLEIVHDLAPNAQLVFCSDAGTSGYGDLADAITVLQGQSCKVIVDDVKNKTEPFFTDEDPVLGAAIRSFISGGGVYVSAVGNDNYDTQNSNGYFIYSGVTDIRGQDNTFASNLTYLEVEAPPLQGGVVFFQWAEQWVNPSHDYDLYVFDETGQNNEGVGGVLRQGGSVPPRETVFFSNSSASVKLFRIIVRAPFSSSSGTDFKIISNFKLRNSFTNNRHAYGHRGYPNVIGVAAYSADLPNTMAYYSSWGPLKMYSTVSSTWYDQEIPLITATSKVSTYVGSVLHQFENPFEGTSAAAPHIAAIAGLYFSRYPLRTRENFINDLKLSGATIYSVGGSQLTGGYYHQQSGYGKAEALACFQRAELEVAGAPTFVPPSCTIGSPGCGSASSVDVSISTTIANATIHYTLDGFTEPTSTSPTYSGPIHLTSTTTIKAKAFMGLFQSPPSSATYVLAGQGAISITGIGPTEIQIGQTTVRTTVSFTRQRAYPNGVGCPSRETNILTGYIDGVARWTRTGDQGNTFQYSYDLTEGCALPLC